MLERTRVPAGSACVVNRPRPLPSVARTSTPSARNKTRSGNEDGAATAMVPAACMALWVGRGNGQCICSTCCQMKYLVGIPLRTALRG